MEGKPADQEPHCCHSELPLRHRGKEVSEGAGEHRGGLEPRGFGGEDKVALPGRRPRVHLRTINTSPASQFDPHVFHRSV